MYQSFSDYRQRRDTLEFANKFEGLCEAIALCGVDFDTYWEMHALPVLLNMEAVEDEEQLIVELRPLVNEAWYNPMSWGKSAGPSQKVLDRAAELDQQRSAQQARFQPDPRFQTNPENQKKYDAFSGQVKKMTDDIKARFGQSMRAFVQAVSNDAKQQNNPHLWKLAQNFQKRVMQAADGFTQQIKVGKSSYTDDFARERDAMNQNVAADKKAALQGRLAAAKADPAGREKLAQAQHGNAKQQLMAQAQQMAKKNPGFTVDMLIGPDGNPTQLGQRYLTPPERWIAGGVKPEPQPVKVAPQQPLRNSA